jgi:hypothetical protein
VSLKIEEIRDLLAQKFSLEKKRLKTYGTKTDSIQMANVCAQYVRAFMSYARSREGKRILKHVNKRHIINNPLRNYLKERIKATSRMAKAIKHVAEETEKKRPWKKTVEHKHKHRNKK